MPDAVDFDDDRVGTDCYAAQMGASADADNVAFITGHEGMVVDDDHGAATDNGETFDGEGGHLDRTRGGSSDGFKWADGFGIKGVASIAVAGGLHEGGARGRRGSTFGGDTFGGG